MRLKYFILPIAIIILSSVIIVIALNLEEAAPIIVGDGLQPRVFPIFLMTLNIFLALIMIWQFFKSPPKSSIAERFPTIGSILLFGLFYILASYIDLFIGIATVIFLMSRLWGNKRILSNLALAVITPLTIFLLFDLVLKIRFPRGLLTDWYYG
ncbi:MAG: hypothetical protein CMM17_11775 [Rhodospirillaceae bacterium]|nr:hypothetical protein [Rhodospirillaceae bacterium]